MYIHSQLLFKLIQRFPIISKFITVSDGYIPDKESDKDYIFGAETLKKTVLQEDGQWTKVLPEDEIQRGRYVETMACTCFSLLNCIEMIVKRKYGADWNKSDRYSAKVTGVTRRGNGMRNVLDKTRKKYGVVNETSYPWDRATFNWSRYYSNVPAQILMLGNDFLKEYEIGYEKVYTNKHLMMQALKYSPLYVAGYAWYAKNGLYRSYGRANHCFTIVGYVEGSHWLAYDSYSPYLKKLDWNFRFGSAYVILLAKKDKEIDRSFIDYLMNRGFTYIQRTDGVNGGSGQVYELSKYKIRELTEQEKLEKGIQSLAKTKVMTGISELDYGKLFK